MLFNISDQITYVRNEMLDGEVFYGVKSGFNKLDDITGGLWNREFIVIGSRPSMGKTALALSILEKTAIDDERTSVLFTLDNSAQQVMKRLIYQRDNLSRFKKNLQTQKLSVSGVFLLSIIVFSCGETQKILYRKQRVNSR